MSSRREFITLLSGAASMAACGAGAAVGPGAADRCAGRTLIGAQQGCVPRSSFALAFFDLDLLLLLRDLRWLW
jgi:hypothetical protein